MKDIKTTDIIEQQGFTVLLLWAEGCHVCETAKPAFQELSQKFPFNFCKLQLGTQSMEFYKEHESPVPMIVQAQNDDGTPIIDAKGNPLTTIARDDNGEVVTMYETKVPMYYVLHNDEISEDNKYGLLGKVAGHNIAQLEAILTQLNDMVQEESKGSTVDSQASQEVASE